jgi:3-dehydroquinate synthase
MNTKILDFNTNLDSILELDLFNRYQELIFITDDIIGKTYSCALDFIATKFKEKNKKFIIYDIPNGEKSKNIETKIKIENFMFSNNISRSKSCLVALGGGVVGDISGYVASTYKRGIDFIQIPTTIISMVDSSIGGKNGINNQHGKNLVGTFHLPKYILIFYALLETLPEKEFINGMAEIIKIASLSSKSYLWNLLYSNDLNSIFKHKDILYKIIFEAAKLKIIVCNQDLYDNSISKNIELELPREHLNFGHTIGHIIEYSENIPHGYSVALGMLLELKLQPNKEVYNQMESCLKKYKLPVDLNFNINESDIEDYLKNDKKDGRIVLLSKIGKSYTQKFSIQEIKNIILNK